MASPSPGRGTRGFRFGQSWKEEKDNLPEGTTGPQRRLDTGASCGETLENGRMRKHALLNPRCVGGAESVGSKFLWSPTMSSDPGGEELEQQKNPLAL